jgi:hypothetical protein
MGPGRFTLSNQQLNKRKGRRDAEGAKIFVVCRSRPSASLSTGFSRELFLRGSFFAANNATGAKYFNN